MNLEILKVQQNRNNLKCSTKQFFLIVDSQLAKESNIGVQEMVNGCMCCVLVGQMKLALQELKGKKKDDVLIAKMFSSTVYFLLFDRQI